LNFKRCLSYPDDLTEGWKSVGLVAVLVIVQQSAADRVFEVVVCRRGLRVFSLADILCDAASLKAADFTANGRSQLVFVIAIFYSSSLINCLPSVSKWPVTKTQTIAVCLPDVIVKTHLGRR